MRHSFYAFLFLFTFCVFAAPVKAQVAGDSCAGTATNATVMGESQTLVCDGTNFKLMVETDSAGRSNLQIDDDTDNACDASKLGRLAYDDGVDTWQYCDGTNWVDLVGASGGGGVVPFFFDFTDLFDQETSAVVNSDTVLISGIASALQVTISGDGSPEFRICDNFNCGTVDHTWGSANQNIDNGQYLQLRLTVPQVESATNTVIVSVGDAVADWRVTTPEGLTVFVTSAGYSSNLGGLSGADDKCNTRASAGGLSGSYKAWLSDSSSSPSSRFTNKAGSKRPYIMTNGTFIADSWADLTDSSLDAALDRTETIVQASQNVWVNTYQGGSWSTSVNESCQDWTSISGSYDGRSGRSWQSNSTWEAADTNMGCTGSTNNRLYCFEDGASSGSASAPPSYVGDWIFLGSIDSTYAGTCNECDSGLDIPANTVELVLMALIGTSELSWSSYGFSFTTDSETGCVVVEDGGQSPVCLHMTSPGVYGNGNAIKRFVVEDVLTSDSCAIELQPNDANIYYTDTETDRDCVFAIYYR